jgi:cytochrome c-type biogenesis protein CcmE
MKPPHIIALVVIVVCMGATLFALSGAMAQHVSIEQALKRPNEVVQVPGNIVRETVMFDAMKGRLSFDIADLKDNTKRMKVVYAQPKPENFDSAKSVEAVGSFKDGTFYAQNLLIKCPSKYSDEGTAKVAEK